VRTANTSARSDPSVTFNKLRTAERISVIVSIVATASYSGVESRTRFLPTRPAALAASSTIAKTRSGSVDLRRRSRMSTNTVWEKIVHSEVS